MISLWNSETWKGESFVTYAKRHSYLCHSMQKSYNLITFEPQIAVMWCNLMVNTDPMQTTVCHCASRNFIYFSLLGHAFKWLWLDLHKSCWRNRISFEEAAERTWQWMKKQRNPFIQPGWGHQCLNCSSKNEKLQRRHQWIGSSGFLFLKNANAIETKEQIFKGLHVYKGWVHTT